MKRLRRILFNTLTAISLLLAIATAGLWVRSVFAFDGFILTPDLPGDRSTTWGYHQSRGSFSLHQEVFTSRYRQGLPFFDSYHGSISDAERRLLPEGWGFSFSTLRPEGRMAQSRWEIWLPFWFPLVLFGLLPAVRIVMRVRHRKDVAEHRCPACGYDMRANPAKCSECGHEVAAKTPVDMQRS